MPSEGYFDFAAGQKPTAAQIEDYLLLQGILRFASAAARDAALPAAVLSGAEGLVCYLKDVNCWTLYTGGLWSTIGPVHGALTSWAPTITQSGTVTATTTGSWYTRSGRQIICNLYASVTGSGTGGNVVTVSLPVTAATSNGLWGRGLITDSSASLWYPGDVNPASTTTVRLLNTGIGTVNSYLGVSGFAAALASGDTLAAFFTYDAAADA